MKGKSAANSELDENWDLIISGKAKGYELGLSDLWRYRDLMVLLVQV